MKANAFASTFAFFAYTQARQKNAKELASKRTGQRRTGANLTRHSYEKTEGYAANSTLPKVAVSFFVGQFCRCINFNASYESSCCKSPPSASCKPLWASKTDDSTNRNF